MEATPKEYSRGVNYDEKNRKSCLKLLCFYSN